MSHHSAHFVSNSVSSPLNISILPGSEPEILSQNDLDSARSTFCPRGLEPYGARRFMSHVLFSVLV